MKFKERLGYIALGGLLVFMGQLLPNIVTGRSATAQNDKESVEFDEVACRRLKIVDAGGKTYALLEKAEGGEIYRVIQVFDDAGKTVSNIGGNSYGGYISVHASGSRASVSLEIGSQKKDGRVSVTTQDGSRRAQMLIDERGGRVTSLTGP
jgi:hypothetical protein